MNFATLEQELEIAADELSRPAGRSGSGPVVRTIRVVAKSYIAPIASRTGTTWCSRFDPVGARVRLAGLAASVDAIYGENPLSDVPDKRYRLYSACDLRVTCQGGRLVSVVPSTVDTDVGLECVPGIGFCLLPPAMGKSPVRWRRLGPAMMEFRWSGMGRPHALAEPLMQAACPRTSVYIWHQVSGRIVCTTSGPVLTARVTGSRFPSHRVFVDGALQMTLPQGDLSHLWVPDPGSPARVR